MTNRPDDLKVEARGEREIVITRSFDAPRRLVFDALTRPELLKRWLGVFAGWSMTVCEVDLRVGGEYRYVWNGPDGATMGMRGTFREITPPERIVNTEKFEQPWYPGEAVGTAVLTERAGRTTLTTTVSYDSREIRDAALKSGMEQGISAGYATLDGILASEHVGEGRPS
jgi:uncharacterized protein YndB with AHSA1/START domain